MRMAFVITVVLILAALIYGAYTIMHDMSGALVQPPGPPVYTSTTSQGGSSSIGSSSAPTTTMHAWG